MGIDGLRTPIIGLAFGAVALLVIASLAHARDGGDYSGNTPKISAWFQSLMQPDNAAVSCCGDADAYWADEFVTEGGELYAIITDDRGEQYDKAVGREHREIGARFLVPDRKLKFDQGNPTGHGVVFLSSTGSVICYIAPGGV